MAHPIESELIEATGYKLRTKFSDRQDYLGSILNAVMKLADDDFDNLSDDAAGWANAAVNAKNNKDDIPDFDEVEETDADEPEDGDDDTSEEADDESEDDGDSDAASDDSDADDDDDSDEGSDPAPDDEDEDDPDDEDEDDDPTDDNPEDDGDDEDDEPAPAKKSKPKPPSKPVKKAAEKPVKKTPKRTPHGKNDDVVLDRWGCMEGSKNSQALALFAKGATSKEVKEKLGGTYYNILKKMEQDGHTLEKEGAVITLIHKDDKGKKAASKPAAKATAKKPEKAPAKKGKK